MNPFGIRIAVVLAAAILALHTAAWAQTLAAASSLPVGTPLTIVVDETVDARVRPGSEFRAHLRDPLALGETLVATAGTPARLVVIASDRAADEAAHFHIAIVGLYLGAAGELPVRPVSPIVERITAGMAIPATTLASIGYEQGKVRVAIPLPLHLSNEPPSANYTAAPLRTAAPILQRRKPTPAPRPSPTLTPEPSATGPMATATPAPMPAPS